MVGGVDRGAGVSITKTAGIADKFMLLRITNCERM